MILAVPARSAHRAAARTALLLNVRGGSSLVTLDESLAAMAGDSRRQALALIGHRHGYLYNAPALCECFGYDGVQKWVQSSLDDPRPLAVLDAADAGVYRGRGSACWRHRTKAFPSKGSHSPKHLHRRSTHLCLFLPLFSMMFSSLSCFSFAAVKAGGKGIPYRAG